MDFSGAADAGSRIWGARSTVRENSLWIEECLPAEALPGSGRERPKALAVIRRLVESHPGAVFGMDFPFSLPAVLLRSLSKATTWEQFVLEFAGRFPTPEAFRTGCLEASSGRELRRGIDREARTPFSAYNLRLYLQTYFGISDILSPLVGAGLVSVLPMQHAEMGKAWLMEICPASTLKRIEIYAPYKGRTPSYRSARRVMMTSIEKKGPLSFVDRDTRDTVLDNQGGDALDSVVAAFAVFKNLQDPSFDVQRPLGTEEWRTEGYVYT